jgi:hypothetical protein
LAKDWWHSALVLSQRCNPRQPSGPGCVSPDRSSFAGRIHAPPHSTAADGIPIEFIGGFTQAAAASNYRSPA